MQMRHISISCWVDELVLFGNIKSMAVMSKVQRPGVFDDEILRECKTLAFKKCFHLLLCAPAILHIIFVPIKGHFCCNYCVSITLL